MNHGHSSCQGCGSLLLFLLIQFARQGKREDEVPPELDPVEVIVAAFLFLGLLMLYWFVLACIGLLGLFCWFGYSSI